MKLEHAECRMLEKRRTRTLARMWRQLNKWDEWPLELPDRESREDWEKGRRRALLAEIVSIVGHRALLEVSR